jgi:hypothetical protein
MNRFSSLFLFLALTAWFFQAQTGEVIYVAKTGSDNNNGFTAQTAKLTIAAAVAQLPHLGKMGSGGAHYGLINIGPGLFVENGNLELNQGISYIGSQTNIVGLGTTIQLANNVNEPLFSYTADWITSQRSSGAYSHYVSLRNLDLDGNFANNTSTTANDDLVDLVGGGYNTAFENVSFQNARRYGLYLNEKQVSFSCFNCTFGADQGGAVYANDTGSGTVVTFVDTQLDNDGTDAITINTANDNYANGGTYVFINLKAEGTVPQYHNHIIRHNPASGNLTYPPAISVIGSYAYSTASADAMFYESTGRGTEARWNIQNAFAQMGYRYGVFRSAKSGVKSQSNSVSQMISNDPSYEASTRPSMVAPDIQISNAVTISGGGNPSGAISANPGSLYLDRTDGELWLKRTGTGSSGWVQVVHH